MSIEETLPEYSLEKILEEAKRSMDAFLKFDGFEPDIVYKLILALRQYGERPNSLIANVRLERHNLLGRDKFVLVADYRGREDLDQVTKDNRRDIAKRIFVQIMDEMGLYVEDPFVELIPPVGDIDKERKIGKIRVDLLSAPRPEHPTDANKLPLYLR